MSTYLTSKAADIQQKANSLSSTAKTHSTSELGHTNETDLNESNTPQDGLTGKAETLKNKAEALHTAADEIVKEAATSQSSPLQDLSDPATLLKDAAKKDEGSDGLFEAAQSLAKKKGEPATTEANQVIAKFETVEKDYLELMKQAGTNKLTDHPKVIAVVKTYHAVKTTYYQMLITYRIQQKAEKFYKAANQLKDAAKAQNDNPLGKLQKAASHDMEQLVTKANGLKREAEKLDKAYDSEIVDKYLEVVQKYNELEAKPEFIAAKDVPQVKEVTKEFDVHKNSYENVLRLRVQELAQKSEDLNKAASALSGVPELQPLAQELAKAASETPSNGLKEKAAQLVGSINGPGSADAKATQVIQQFDTVTKAYNELTEQPKYQELLEQPDEKVQKVANAYKALKTLYDSILNFTKMKQPANDLDAKASQIATGNSVTKPSEVKPLIDKLESVYSAIPDDQSDIKSIFQNDFESI